MSTNITPAGFDRLGAPIFDWAALPMAEDRGDGWAALREIGPVVLMQDCYYITERGDVLAALRDPELFSSKKAFDELGSPLPLVPIAFDPPEHTRFRKILQPFFSPHALSGLLPSLRRQAIEIVDAAAAGTECEVMADIAVPYPSQVFLTLFGLPLKDRDRLIAWKDAVIQLSELPDMQSGDLTPALELFGYLTEAIGAKRSAPGADILSELLTGEDALDDADALGLGFLFVLAGLDTVTSVMGSAFLALARDSGLRKTLRDNPDQTPVFVEEIVRLEPPAPILPRVTTRETTVGGITLPANSRLRLCLGTINRDDFDELSVNEIVMDGKIHRHWGFGGGPHRCLGNHLARMELTLIVDEWLKRVPDFRISDGFVPRIVFPANTFAIDRLPLLLTP